MRRLLWFFVAAIALAQDRPLPPIPRYEVPRSAKPLQIDGRLDEPAWRTAPTITFQFPWEQQTGAKQKTTARLLWDDTNLYVAYECEDTDITAQFDQHDDPTYRDDAVELFINPKPAQTHYYGLEMNARAVLYDYFYDFPIFLLKRWDLAGVQLATKITGTLNASGDQDQGWTLEVAIPWKNFEDLAGPMPPKPGAVWTANLNRWDGTEPNRRLSLWSDSGLKNPHPHNPARFGELVFK